MSASRGQKKLHSNSDVAPPEPPKRARKAPQKYEPPAPSKPSKKRAPARSKRPANAPAPEPSPDRESEVEDVPSSPPPPPTAPLYVPYSIYIYTANISYTTRKYFYFSYTTGFTYPIS